MKFRAVIFDRDGVLTYFDNAAISQNLAPLLPISVQALVLRWNRWGSRVGYPTSLEEEAWSVGRFWRDLCEEYDLSLNVQESLLAVDYTSFMRPFPDALPALEYVRSLGLKTGVLSNFSLASLEESLVAVGLNEMVDVACAATTIGASKPDPEAYSVVAERLGVDPSDCLFFDDEVGCVDGALAVGMHAYLIDRQETDDEIDSVSNVLPDLSAIRRLI